MEQYKQISFIQAMEMVNNDKLDSLYFKKKDGSIDKAKSYVIDFREINNKQYYKRELIK